MAEDLAQDTFVKALLTLDESHTNMRAWLYTVAKNLFLNTRKQQSRFQPLDDHLTEDAQQEPLHDLLRSEQQMLLFRVMNRLDDRKKEIIQLQYFSGLSQREIAAVMGLTPANVRVLAHRGKQELKRFLEEEYDDIS